MTPPFASRVESFDTDDVDEFTQRTGGWSIQYHLLDTTAFRSAMFIVMTPSLHVALVRHATGYSSQGENPAGMLSIVAPLDEARPMVYRGRALEPMESALMRSGDGYECVCRAGARFSAVSLAQAKVERYAADMWHQPNLLEHQLDRLRFVDAERHSRYLDACRRVLGAVETQPGLLSDPNAIALSSSRACS